MAYGGAVRPTLARAHARIRRRRGHLRLPRQRDAFDKALGLVRYAYADQNARYTCTVQGDQDGQVPAESNV